MHITTLLFPFLCVKFALVHHHFINTLPKLQLIDKIIHPKKTNRFIENVIKHKFNMFLDPLDTFLN